MRATVSRGVEDEKIARAMKMKVESKERREILVPTYVTEKSHKLPISLILLLRINESPFAFKLSHHHNDLLFNHGTILRR